VPRADTTTRASESSRTTVRKCANSPPAVRTARNSVKRFGEPGSQSPRTSSTPSTRSPIAQRRRPITTVSSTMSFPYSGRPRSPYRSRPREWPRAQNARAGALSRPRAAWTVTTWRQRGRWRRCRWPRRRNRPSKECRSVTAMGGSDAGHSNFGVRSLHGHPPVEQSCSGLHVRPRPAAHDGGCPGATSRVEAGRAVGQAAKDPGRPADAGLA